MINFREVSNIPKAGSNSESTIQNLFNLSFVLIISLKKRGISSRYNREVYLIGISERYNREVYLIGISERYI